MSNAEGLSELQGNGERNQGRTGLTPELYARQVWAFAKRWGNPLYPGKHYTALARLLISEYQRHSTEEGPTIEDTSSTAIYIHDLTADDSTPKRVLPISTIEQLDRYDDETRRRKPCGRLVFVQGYVSPKWLNHMGSKFRVDPEFYYRHLDFSSSQLSPNHYSMLSLPSCSSDIIRLRITSIVSWNDFQSSTTETIDSLRRYCSKVMNEYLHDLAKGQRVTASDSIIRRFSVHDKNTFSIEQMITIHVNYDSPGWVVIIWLDQGRDLQLSSHGPLGQLRRSNNSSSSIQPIIQYRKRIALRRELRTHNGSAEPGVSSLPFSYGNSLGTKLMGSDVFYALDELFRLSIASEAQFLTFLKHKIRHAINANLIDDLQCSLDIVEEHREHIKETMSSVSLGGHPDWPKAAEEEDRARTTAAQESLLKDLKHLQDFASHLADRCTSGISIMMNEAMFHQSQRAINQAEATMKLSVLLFFFAPFSLTTSFFSMSLKEIQEHRLSIWVWAVASAVLVGMSIGFWKWDVVQLVRVAWIQFHIFPSPTSARYRR